MICAFSSANNFFSSYVHCQNKFLSQSLSLIKTHQPFGTPFIENLPSYPGSQPHHPLSHLSDAPPHFLPSTILGAALWGRLWGLQMAETQPKPAQRKSGLYVLQWGCACFRNFWVWRCMYCRDSGSFYLSSLLWVLPRAEVVQEAKWPWQP